MLNKALLASGSKKEKTFRVFFRSDYSRTFTVTSDTGEVFSYFTPNTGGYSEPFVINGNRPVKIKIEYEYPQDVWMALYEGDDWGTDINSVFGDILFSQGFPNMEGTCEIDLDSYTRGYEGGTYQFRALID